MICKKSRSGSLRRSASNDVQTRRTAVRRRRARSSRGRRARARRAARRAATASPVDLADEQLDRGAAHRLDRLADGRQRRIGAVHERRVVVADDRDVVGHVQAGAAGAPGSRRARAGRWRRRSPVTPALDQPGRRGLAALEREQRALDRSRRARCPRACDRLRGAELAARRNVVGRPEQQRRCARGRASSGARRACSIATASSVETRGKPRSSAAALTSTTGRLRSVRRA